MPETTLYAIWLSDTHIYDLLHCNYGYWTGKTFQFQGELFPVCTNSSADSDIKFYSTLKRAQTGLEACLNRGYAYVVDGKVVEFREGESVW